MSWCRSECLMYLLMQKITSCKYTLAEDKATDKIKAETKSLQPYQTQRKEDSKGCPWQIHNRSDTHPAASP